MLKNLAKFFLVIVLSSILILAIFRHSLVRFLITNALVKATGLELSIEDLNLDILKNSLSLHRVTLFNPPKFENVVLGKAKEILIRYDLLGLLGGRFRFPQIKADIEEINIIKNESGNTNLPSFKKGQVSTSLASETTKAEPAPKAARTIKRKPEPKFQIDSLEVSLAKVTFINYNAKIGEPAVIIFTSKGPLTFKNVNNLNEVAKSVSVKMGFRDILENYLESIWEKLSPGIIKNSSQTFKKKIQDILPKKR